jgi:cytochrome c oxidase subunit III
LSDAAVHTGAHGHEHADAHHPALQHHFDTMQQQKEASVLGMWVFLLTEILFFGGLFMAYTLYRIWYYDAFVEGSLQLDLFWGTLNTAVLIGSSLTMALAVRAAQTNNRKLTMAMLIATMVLGTVFLGVKVIEYEHKFAVGLIPGPDFVWPGNEAIGRNVQIFYSLYFTMTGLHALHMIIGLGIMSVILWMAYKHRFDSEYYAPVEMTGLYWHFVDIVWIYLFPLLYLVERHN